MSKFRDIKTCNVTTGTIIVWGEGPDFSDGPVSYRCTERFPGYTAAKQIGASMWTEMPKIPVRGKKASGGYTAAFEDIWAKYPRTRATSKADALKAWNRLTDAEQEQVRRALPLFIREKAGTEERFIPHLSSWLNGKYFETIAQPVAVPSAGLFDQPGPAAITGDTWRRAMSLYEKTNNWNPLLGNSPGTPGCRVPPEILREFRL